jgi:hypothetical protein
MINCLSCGAECNSDWLHCPSCGGSIQKQLAAAALAQEKVKLPTPAVEKPTQPKETPVAAKKPVKKAKLQLDDYASASEIADKLLAAQVASKIEAKPLQGSKESKSDFDFREEEMLLDHLRYASKTQKCKKCNTESDVAFFTIWIESGFSEEELSALATVGEGEKTVVGNGFSVTVRSNNCAHIRTDHATEVKYAVGGTLVSQTNWNPLFVKASHMADALADSGFADEIPTTLSSRQYDADERQQFADDQFRVAHLTGQSKSKSGFQFVLLLSTHSVPLSKGMQHDMSDLGFPAVRVVDDGWHIEIHEEADDIKASLKLAKSIVDSFGGSILSSES